MTDQVFELIRTEVLSTGDFGAGGGGGGPVIVSRWQAVTAQSLPGAAWSAALAWDDPDKAVDPEGILETSTYKTFTIPVDCILEVWVSIAKNSGSAGDTEGQLQSVDPADGTTPIQIPFQEGKAAIMNFSYHTQNVGDVGVAHWVGFCAAGTAFQLRLYTNGVTANCHTDSRFRVQMTIWPV